MVWYIQNVSRSTDTLTKSTVTDYKKMMSNGSIDSMDKSALSSETSYDIYEGQQRPPNSVPGYNDILNQKYNEYSQQPKATIKRPSPPETTKVYGLPEYNPAAFELSYRNEGFRDNSTYGGGITRNNSISTYINEDTPIIHQIDPEDGDGASDYYGNSSTLPMRAKGDNLSFLSELTHKLPEYEKLPQHKPEHSSFLPTPPDPPYDKTNKRSPIVQPQSHMHEYEKPEVRRPNEYNEPQIDVRRPDSYYTAMKTARHSNFIGGAGPSNGGGRRAQRNAAAAVPQPTLPPSHSPPSSRPKTVYEASGDDRPAYPRSKSEALLETNFDEDMPTSNNPLTSDSRSYSQPLETAM